MQLLLGQNICCLVGVLLGNCYQVLEGAVAQDMVCSDCCMGPDNNSNKTQHVLICVVPILHCFYNDWCIDMISNGRGVWLGSTWVSL